MEDEPERTRRARAAAEAALVRIVHHDGARPEFVVLGGLVPELLCTQSGYKHAGTTDIDVQVDLEIACGSVNGARLEQALKNAEFEPAGKVWRWPSSATCCEVSDVSVRMAVQALGATSSNSAHRPLALAP